MCDYNVMKIQCTLEVSGVVSYGLLYNTLGAISWKYFVTETSKNAESCSEVVL